MKKIVIYTGPNCPHCNWAKVLLNKKEVNFTEYNVGEDLSKRDEMLKKANGSITVPQIFIDDYHVGGNIELQQLEREGKLDNLLKN